ncbi:MAG: DNA polymerase III subunit gamma/tau, partial [Proteobacteria bacterium]|nr:DNA polymerase III subunit gamma/tau [Pseudomonadota bacterium]
MSYLVLARKLRPARFKDLIGQESISQTLINAIASDRVAHAFLFTGPRGTGKTSTARILTKALNCSQPVDNEPCNLCENCEEINKGIATDVMEIDAASNRGIEYIRELRAGVKFSPAKCKYKTYIIDEVHMLTTESFNALLKTLEEPPPHVKFILATTDHHKVPSTVISRCQRFDFTNVASKTLLEYLTKVAQNESIEISEKSLNLVVKISCGGVRDALTTMDMLISFGGGTVDDEKVIELLGINDAAEIDLLLEGIIAQDLEKVLAISRKLASGGRSLTHLVIDLMKVVKDLSMVTGLSRSKIQWKEFLPDQLELYQKLSDKVTQETLQQYFQILLDVESQI